MARIVVVGAGKVGRRHLAAYAAGAGTAVGVVEPSDERFEDIPSAERRRLQRFETLEHALASPEVEVIDICTPTPAHFSQAELALCAGKSVFCEKPAVTSVADVEALGSILDTQTFRVAYPYRFHPRVTRLKHFVDVGALGRPHLAYLRIGGRGSHRAWKHQRDAGGGVVPDMASHMLDLAYWLFGSFRRIETVHRSLIQPKREIDGEVVAVDADDVVSFLIETIEGVQVHVHADFVTPGFWNSIEVAGSNGSATVSVVSGVPDRYVTRSDAGDLAAGESILAGESADMFARELAEFVAAHDRGEVVQDLESSLEVTRAIEKYEEALR